MNTNRRIWLCALFLAGFWACSDDSENANEPVTEEDAGNVASIDEATVTFMDPINLSNEILSDEGVVNGRVQQCFGVSETQTENQLLVTFESNCEGLDGRFRSGSFTITWDGSMETNDFSYTIDFDGYTVDDYGLEGSITVSDLTYRENGFAYRVRVNDGVVTIGEEHILYEQDLDYDYDFSEGFELRITGSISGVGKEGVSYEATIKEPILVVSGCEYAVSGSFDATFDGRPTVTANYGDGTCDNVLTLRRGDHSLNVELD